MAVTLQDIANQVNTFTKGVNDEIKVLKQELNNRVDESDRERKKLGETLTSKTAETSGEYKGVFDRINDRINALTDLVDKYRIDNLKSAFAAQDANVKGPGYKSFFAAIRNGGYAEGLSEEEKSYTFQQYMCQFSQLASFLDQINFPRHGLHQPVEAK